MWKHRLSISVLICGLLSGCASVQQLADEAGGAQDVATGQQAMPASAGGTSDLMYDILLGELAGQRNQLDTALTHYERAAAHSDDPRVAERALRIALFAKQEDAALAAARRWVGLAPDALDARQMLAALALRQGDEDEAFNQLEYSIAAMGGDDEAFQAATGLLGRDQDQAAAKRVMGRLLERYPDLPEAQLAYARLSAHSGDLETGLAHAVQALELRPGWSQALVLRAHIRLQLEQVEQAMQELRTALNAQPSDTEVRLALARLLLEQERYDDAAAQFERVLAQEPENGDVLYSLGLLSIEAERLERAKGYFKRLITLGENQAAANYYLGRIAEQQKDPQSAIGFYEQIRESEYWLEGQIRVAVLRGQHGELERARRLLQELRVRDPNLAPRLYIVESDLFGKLEDHAGAMDILNRALGESPGHHDLLYARALVAEKLDDLSLAETDLRTILDEDPDNAHALNALGYTLADRTQRLDEALGYITQALELAPNEPSIIDSMGWVHYRLGNLNEAEQHLRRAFDLSQDGEIGAHLAEVLWSKGEHDKARSVLREANEYDPENPVLRRVRSRLMP